MRSHHALGEGMIDYADTYDALYQTGYHAGGLTHAAWCLDQVRARYGFATVLDVGCGVGIAVGTLNDEGHAAFGVDVSAEAVQQGTERGTDYLIVAGATDLPFSRGTFDATISSDTLEHLTPGDVPDALREMVRVTRDVLILQVATVPERNRQPPKRARRAGFEVPDHLHLTVEPMEWWTERLEEAGCRVEAHRHGTWARIIAEVPHG